MRKTGHKVWNRLASASLLLVGIANLAHADVISIPASGGMIATPTECGYLLQYGIGSFSGSSCHFQIPIPVPVGHTIQQVNVIHGSIQFLGGQYVHASLSSSATSGYIDFADQFPWSSSNNVFPDNFLESTRLMAQLGKNYQDAFVVPPDRMYQISVEVSGAAYVAGIQVTYQ